MAELFRHTDPDGYTISVYTAPVGPGLGAGIVIDSWPEHQEGRLVCVEIDDEHGRRLLAALQEHFNGQGATG